VVKLNQVYGLESPIQNNHPLPVNANRLPTVDDKNYFIGQLWIVKNTGSIFTFTGTISGEARWLHTGLGSNDLGTASLTDGESTINDSILTVDDDIFITRISVGASTLLGHLEAVSTIGSFTIRSLDPTDQSIETGDQSLVNFQIIREIA